MAAILALGILLVSRLEEARKEYFLFGPPLLRILTEKAPNASVRCELTGTVLSARVSGDRVSLTVRAGKDAGRVLVALENNEELPLPGCRVRMTGRTELFDPALNPGAFSYRDYYDSIGIWLRFRAESCEVLTEGSRLLRLIYGFRNSLSDTISTYADPEDQGILKSMLLSDSSEQDREEREAFSFLGLMQMISLSGLQIVLLGSLIFGYIRKRTGRKLPAFLAGLLLVLLLTVFSGFSMAAIRAVVIYCMRAGAVFLKRHFDFASAGALALILLMLEAPLRIYTSGFQFMAGILAAIGILNDLVLRFLNIRGGVYRGIFTALSVQVILLPVRICHSFAWSLLSPFLYALLFPAAGIIFILGALGTVAGLISGPLSSFLLGAEHYFIVFLRTAAALGNQAGGLTVICGRPSETRVFVYFLICFLLAATLRIILNRRKENAENEELRITPGIRISTAAAFLSIMVFGLLFLRAEPLPEDSALILMMDCGQGDAFLIRFSDGTVMLSDAGSSSDDSFYREQLSKTLLFYGIDKIDYVLASHPDTDHISGLTELFSDARFDIGYLIYAEILADDPSFLELFRQAEQAGVLKLPASAGKTLILPDAELRFLWPPAHETVRGNEASLVFLLEYQGFLALFTGDISEGEERKILPLPDVDILKVAHHGSRFSSSDAFLAAVSPELALISCGKNNSYGHPAKETLDRLQTADAIIYTTQHEGAVFVSLDHGRILVKQK